MTLRTKTISIAYVTPTDIISAGLGRERRRHIANRAHEKTPRYPSFKNNPAEWSGAVTASMPPSQFSNFDLPPPLFPIGESHSRIPQNFLISLKGESPLLRHRLCIGRKLTGYSIIQDGRYPHMWRVERPDGALTDLVNQVRARDAALTLAGWRLPQTFDWK
jgi:hypothetical protein